MINPPAETGSMLGQWWLHTGCKMIGADPLFPGVTGTWDGTTLTADVHAEGYCDGGNMWSGPSSGPLPQMLKRITKAVWPMASVEDDGPVHVRFGAELTVAE
ncbi:MAG: hypothetical protein R2911_11695 [Caldilineaceae bacterium]